MVDFESIKERALATVGRVAEKSVDIAKAAGEKAKLAGRITKLKTEIAMEKDTLRKTFAELGKMYYEKHKDNPTHEMAQAVADAGLSLEILEAKQAEVDALKKELIDDIDEILDDDIDVEIEVVEIVEDVSEEKTEE